DIHRLCSSYHLDAVVVINELKEFVPVCRLVHHKIKMDDMAQSHTMRQPETTNPSSDSVLEEQMEAIPTHKDSKDNEGEAMEREKEMEREQAMEREQEMKREQARAKWLEHSFIKPLRVLEKLT